MIRIQRVLAAGATPSLLLGTMILLSGCDQGGADKGANEAQVSAQRKAEIEAQGKASEEYYKQQQQQKK